MKKEDIQLLEQLVNSLEKAIHKLEESYEEKKYDNFNKVKKFILEVEDRVLEVIK